MSGLRTPLVGLLLVVALAACDRAPAAKLPAIAGIQAGIAAADMSPEHYFRDRYAPEEPRYWTRIAGWIVEDSIVRNYARRRPATAILDIGCGYGTLLSWAADVHGAPGICMDVVPYLQPQVMARHRLRFAAGNVEKDPLPPGRFDVVLMTEVLEHLNFQPVPTLRKIRAALADGGAFFLSTPDAGGGWGRTRKYYPSLSAIPPLDPAARWIDGHIWQYDEDELRGVMREAGFEILRLERSDGPQGKHMNVWAVPAPGG
ncbi:MAG: class I SAM-dependent methyltransferase [Gammaproteobacteria bacterium]